MLGWNAESLTKFQGTWITQRLFKLPEFAYSISTQGSCIVRLSCRTSSATVYRSQWPLDSWFRLGPRLPRTPLGCNLMRLQREAGVKWRGALVWLSAAALWTQLLGTLAVYSPSFPGAGLFIRGPRIPLARVPRLAGLLGPRVLWTVLAAFPDAHLTSLPRCSSRGTEMGGCSFVTADTCFLALLCNLSLQKQHSVFFFCLFF